MFTSWANPCGTTANFPPALKGVFDALNGLDNSILPKGFKPPKNIKPKSKPTATKVDPPKTDDPETDPPKTEDPKIAEPKTADPTASATNSACTKNQKRAPNSEYFAS